MNILTYLRIKTAASKEELDKIHKDVMYQRSGMDPTSDAPINTYDSRRPVPGYGYFAEDFPYSSQDRRDWDKPLAERRQKVDLRGLMLPSADDPTNGLPAMRPEEWNWTRPYVFNQSIKPGTFFPKVDKRGGPTKQDMNNWYEAFDRVRNYDPENSNAIKGYLAYLSDDDKNLVDFINTYDGYTPHLEDEDAEIKADSRRSLAGRVAILRAAMSSPYASKQDKIDAAFDVDIDKYRKQFFDWEDNEREGMEDKFQKALGPFDEVRHFEPRVIGHKLVD